MHDPFRCFAFWILIHSSELNNDQISALASPWISALLSAFRKEERGEAVWFLLSLTHWRLQEHVVSHADLHPFDPGLWLAGGWRVFAVAAFPLTRSSSETQRRTSWKRQWGPSFKNWTLVTRSSRGQHFIDRLVTSKGGSERQQKWNFRSCWRTTALRTNLEHKNLWRSMWTPVTVHWVSFGLTATV